MCCCIYTYTHTYIYIHIYTTRRCGNPAVYSPFSHIRVRRISRVYTHFPPFTIPPPPRHTLYRSPLSPLYVVCFFARSSPVFLSTKRFSIGNDDKSATPARSPFPVAPRARRECRCETKRRRGVIYHRRGTMACEFFKVSPYFFIYDK